MSEIIDSLTVETGVGIAVPSLAIAYFLGHILLLDSPFRETRRSRDQESMAKNQKLTCIQYSKTAHIVR